MDIAFTKIPRFSFQEDSPTTIFRLVYRTFDLSELELKITAVSPGLGKLL